MKKDTKFVTAGRTPAKQYGFVNPPIVRGSTVVFDTVGEFEAAGKNRFDELVYGRFGTPTSFAFEEAMAEIEGGVDKYRSVAVTSGLAAASIGILSFLKAGDHLLLADNIYGPVRKLSETFLDRYGVETDFYDPLIGAGIAEHIKPNTRMIYMEAPGSLTFEMPDMPAIIEVARARNILTAMDNTWATPLFFQPLEAGINISIMAATKYVVGHSDSMLGVVTVTHDSFTALKETANILGNCPGPEDCFLGLRGLRTMAVRLRQHQVNALQVAEWLEAHPSVGRVLYPALESDPGHAVWTRDFSGASGLLAIVLPGYSKAAIDAMIDGYEHFGLGGSFGGYESLVLPVRHAVRSATAWPAGEPAVRFHVGLEDPEDLIADLEAGFERLEAAQRSAGD